MFLENELSLVEELINESDTLAVNVSKKSVGWHLAHILRVFIGVSKSLKGSDPSTYTWKFSAIRTVIFTLNYIPRGKGRAPKSAIPDDEISNEELSFQLEEAKKLLLDIKDLDPNSNFKHPYFNILNLEMTKKFLKLHTKHHLKICRDIIKIGV